MSGLKRSLEESSHDGDRPSPSDSSVSTVKPASPVAPSSSTSFRNVSACNRCRLRKNRCDQRLPSGASCDKAGVKCVGYDPITKREIPRRYGQKSLQSRGLPGTGLGSSLTSATATSTTSKPASPPSVPRTTSSGATTPSSTSAASSARCWPGGCAGAATSGAAAAR